MSEDLIRRSDAIDVLYHYQESVEMGIKSFPLAVKAMNDIPAIEPKRGRWVVLTEDDADGYWKCSVCGTPTEAMGAHMLYNFCPFCGARMKGADDEV